MLMAFVCMLRLPAASALKTCWLGLLLCSMVSSAYAAEIQVSIDRNPVALSESFQITFSASETPDASPDFSPLQANFDILNQQRSSNMSWINGKASLSEQWVLNVMAKQAGELLIPPIAFGADSSRPLKVSVTDAPAAQPSNNADIFLDVEASPEQPYVQSQVIFTLRIYFRVQITRSSLSDLEIKDALVEQLGEDTTYRTQIKGIEYGVLERKYAIFPQQSGLFSIEPMTLTTEVVSNKQPRFNGFFNRQITETRRISSKPVTLNVLPVPASFTDATWLSAESLELSEEWSASDLQTKVGEPLTRTITLKAKGSTVGQLPELSKPSSVAGLKTYPDQPLLREEKASDGLLAVREEKIAYIPSQSGEYELPAVTVNWFNTRTGTNEQARLPALKIHALTAGGGQATPAPVQSETDHIGITPSLQTGTETIFWPAVSAFLALGWLFNVVWFYRRGRKAVASAAQKLQEPVVSNADKQLKTACQLNDSQAAKQALLQWGKRLFAADNLAAIAKQCPAALADEIAHLNQVLYAGGEAQWSGEPLWTAFKQADFSANKPGEKDDALQPLYRL